MPDLKFEITISSNGETVVKNITGGFQGMKAAAEGAAAPMEKLAGATRPLNQALNLLAPQLGLLGPAGNLAGNALLGMAEGMTRTALAGGAAVVGVQAFANALARSRAESENFSAAVTSRDGDFFRKNIDRLNAIASDRANDNIFQQIANQVGALLGGDTDRLLVNLTGKINDYSAALKSIDTTKAQQVAESFSLQARSIGASPLEKINLQASQQINELRELAGAGKMSMLEYKAALQGVGEVKSAGIREFNRGIQEQIELLKAANAPLEQIAIKARQLGGGANVQELVALQQNAARIAAGSPLVAKGFADIGAAALLPKTQLDQLALSAFALDQKFQAGTISAKTYTEGLKDIAKLTLPKVEQDILSRSQELRKELVALRDAAKSPLDQGPSAVFAEKIGATKGLREGAEKQFGFEVPPQVQADLQKTDSLIAQIADRSKIDLTIDANQPFQELGRIQEQSVKFGESAAQPVKMVVDGNGAISIINDVSTALDNLRNKASQPIAIETEARTKGSPTLQFSDYWERYAPGVLNKFSNKASSSMGITLDSGVLNSLMPLLDRWTVLQGKLAAISSGGNFWAFAAPQLSAESNALEGVIGGILNRAPAGSGTGAGGGAVGGNAYVTIDLRGSTIGRDFLRDLIAQEVVPILEDTLARTTGKILQTRVLN